MLSVASHTDLGLAQMEVDVKILKLFGVLELLTDTEAPELNSPNLIDTLHISCCPPFI